MPLDDISSRGMKLTAVTPVVLGLLAHAPRSGYDIKAIVDRSTRFFWAASYGQIYPELRRLERAGLIEGTASATGARKKKDYRLTEAGSAELVKWLGNVPQMPELRDESLLKLFFSDQLPLEQAIEQIRMS